MGSNEIHPLFERDTMFNRKAEVRFVKVRKVTPEEEAADKEEFEDRLVGVTVMTKDIIKQVALFGAGYIVLDTGRKVAVALAEKK